MINAKAIFLDLDNTLLDGSTHQDTIIATCQEISNAQPDLPVDSLIKSNSEVWSTFWPEIADKWMLGKIENKWLSLEAWRQTLQNLDNHDESLLQLAVQTYEKVEATTYRLFSDVPGFIDAIHKRRIPLALITNGASETQRSKIEILKMESWFDAIIISGEVGIVKPDPAIFDLAVNKTGNPQDNIWHIGDNIKTDIIGAKAANINVVWINRNGESYPENDSFAPDLIIRSLSEIPNLIK